MSRKRSASLLVCALMPFGASTQAAPRVAHAVRFVEFYTSEACASCRLADAAFAHLATDKHVITLGFHVGYWDYLGWKDRFALPVSDQRQWDYARCWHRGEVFTPEMIVNGTINGIGDNAGEIAGMLRLAAPIPRVDLFLEKTQVIVSVPALSHAAGAMLWVATFDRTRSVAISHGENAGHVITEANIVRFAAPLALLSDAPLSIPVPAADLAHVDGKSQNGIASFVQAPDCGPIIAAGQLLLNHLP